MKISKNLIAEVKNDFVPLSRDAEGLLKGGFGSLDVASVNGINVLNNCLCQDNNCHCPTQQRATVQNNCSCPYVRSEDDVLGNNCTCGKVVYNGITDPELPSLF